MRLKKRERLKYRDGIRTWPLHGLCILDRLQTDTDDDGEAFHIVVGTRASDR